MEKGNIMAKATKEKTAENKETRNFGEPEVLHKWGEVSDRDLYNIMNGLSAGKMQDLRGQTVSPNCVVIYGRVDMDTGELLKTVFIRMEDGSTYRTPSRSFCETLEKVAEQFFTDDDMTFGVECKTSKVEGREYLVATA